MVHANIPVPRRLFLSTLSLVVVVGGLGESVPGVCEKAPFLFSSRSASVSFETADLQMQHINGEETQNYAPEAAFAAL